MTEQQPPEPPEQQPGPHSQPGQPGQPAWGQQPGQPAWGQPAWGQPQQSPPPGQPAWGQPAGPPAAYGYPGYPQQAYGGYGPQWGNVPQTSGRATTVLVLGIVSLVLLFTCGLGFVPAIISLVLAPGASREVAESGGRLTGDSQIRTGRILSWVTIGLTALGVIIFALFIGIAVSVDGSSSPAEPSVVSPG